MQSASRIAQLLCKKYRQRSCRKRVGRAVAGTRHIYLDHAHAISGQQAVAADRQQTKIVEKILKGADAHRLRIITDADLQLFPGGCCTSESRRTRLSIFPTFDLGSSLRKYTCRGSL